MKNNFSNRYDVAAYVNDWLRPFGRDLPSTMTITQEKSGAYSVSTATAESSEDIGLQTAKFFSETQVNI